MARNNYTFVIDDTFQPFNMQELLTPMLMYKDVSEKEEAAWDELNKNAGVFSYLEQVAKDNPDSKAAQIYTAYANDLKNYGDDFSRNGLSMGNSRALRNLKRRYSGEIGRLETAKQALDKENELRRQLNAKDPSMLYGENNLDIDMFLDSATPNLYSISGMDLYTKGAAAAKGLSSRVFNINGESKTLGGFYRDFIQARGYTQEQLNKFGAEISEDFAKTVSVLPELQLAANQILEANGAKENLRGNSLRKAQQQVIRGMLDNAMYEEAHSPQRDLGVMTAAEEDASKISRAASTRAQQQMELSALQSGYKRVGNKWVLDEEGLKKRAEIMGIGNYNPDEWEMGPDGKPRRKPKADTNTTPEKKAENSKQKELLKLDKGALAHNEGFDVKFDSDRHHYNYIGAISRHGDKWYHGAIGDDNPGHNWLRGWGFGSTSNVENIWGNFSAEPGNEVKSMRVLSPDEMMTLIASDPDILEAIEKQAEAMNVDPTKADIQLIEVPNEKGGGNQKGYLIAAH